MSLSYQLDATNYPWWDSMEQWFGCGPTTTDWNYGNGQLADGTQPMWFNIAGKTAAPTGEVVIRDGYYHNGIYVIVGSYRAYFQLLAETGAPGYAWDGFVLLHRGYNVMESTDPAFDNILDPRDYAIIPMNWPTLCTANIPGDLDDEEVGTGLYAVTPLKNIIDTEVGAPGYGQDDIKIVVGGHHCAPSTVLPTDARTVGAAAQLTFQIQGSGVGNEGRIFYSFEPRRSVLFGLDYDFTPLAPDQTLLYRDWKDVIAMTPSCLGVGASGYQEDMWKDGMLPDGTNPFGPITSSDNSILNNGYVPIKIFGVRSVAAATVGFGKNIDGVVFIAGQMASSTPLKVTENESPFYMTMAMGKRTMDGIYGAVPPLDYLGPWTACVTAMNSTLIAGITTPFMSGLGVYDNGFYAGDTTGGAFPGTNTRALETAAATDIMPPSEIVGADSTTNVTPIILALGNTKYPSSADPRRGALYTANGFPMEGQPSLPIGFAGGGMEDIAGVKLPSIGFPCCLQQFRTYTFSEENTSMRVTTIGNTDERKATPESLWDNDTEQFVGYVGNYPRYDTSKSGGLTAGKQTFQGYAAVGWYDGTDPNITPTAGPCLISYDKGTPTIENLVLTTGGPPPAPVSQGSFDTKPRMRQDGGQLNLAIGVGGGGTPALRKCDWAAWDNDRDQWLFIVSENTGGVSVVSVDAPFTTFLDQSAAFTAAQSSDYTTAMYYPISMSNALDGLVVFGQRIQDVWGNLSMKPTYVGTFAMDLPWGPGTFTAVTSSSMKAYRITGSTGRTARVWIDYMLYDGVDAVIAMQLRDWGMRVTVENVEWFKARVLQDGDMKAKGEEIEEWMEEQGKQYTDMLKTKERSGRLRKRRSQISAYKREVGDLMTPDQIDTQVYDFVPRGLAAQQRLKDSEGALKEVPPDSIEAMVERDYRAGFDTTPSGVTEPGEQVAEDPAKPAGTFMDTGDGPKKAPDEGGDPDEEYISEN